MIGLDLDEIIAIEPSLPRMPKNNKATFNSTAVFTAEMVCPCGFKIEVQQSMQRTEKNTPIALRMKLHAKKCLQANPRQLIGEYHGREVEIIQWDR